MQDFAKLLLRLMVGGLMLVHGINKMMNFDGSMKFVQGLLTKAELPTWMAFGVIFGEVVAPVLVILGLKSRFGAVAIAGTMVFAVYLAHLGDFLAIGKHGEWKLEVQAFYFVGSLCILFMGSGKIALMKD